MFSLYLYQLLIYSSLFIVWRMKGKVISFSITMHTSMYMRINKNFIPVYYTSFIYQYIVPFYYSSFYTSFNTIFILALYLFYTSFHTIFLYQFLILVLCQFFLLVFILHFYTSFILVFILVFHQLLARLTPNFDLFLYRHQVTI